MYVWWGMVCVCGAQDDIKAFSNRFKSGTYCPWMEENSNINNFSRDKVKKDIQQKASMAEVRRTERLQKMKKMKEFKKNRHQRTPSLGPGAMGQSLLL